MAALYPYPNKIFVAGKFVNSASLNGIQVWPSTVFIAPTLGLSQTQEIIN